MDNHIYRPSEDVISSQVGDELILLHTATDKAYGLDTTSAFVWALLDAGGKTRAQLIDDLIGHFDVEHDRAAADLDALLQHFCRENLVCSEPLTRDLTV
ncbi:MAG: PqqD family protein [Porphyrobacter sp.]|jgi:hypothetical protein|nr:PqqD family protein [Porphyrobacter sp.]